MNSRSRRPRYEVDESGELVSLTETCEWGAPNRLVVGLDCRSMNPYRFLRVRFPDVERSEILRWISEGLVLVNGAPLVDASPLRKGDLVEIEVEVGRLSPRRHRPPKLVVLYEDDSMIVVDKPSGLATAPERNRNQPHLLGLIRDRAEKAAAERVPKLVHRIDKRASGIVVFARDREAKRQLVEDFAERRVVKDYLALVSGHVAPEPQTEAARIVPSSRHTTRMEISERRGKESSTALRGVLRFRGYSVVHCRPLTGRTHQIRVHLMHRGHPIVGDELYHGEKELWLSRLKSSYRRARGERERPLLQRLALHAARITLKSPATGETISLESRLPRDLATPLRQLQKAVPLDTDEEFRLFESAPLGPDQDPFGPPD